MTAIIFVAIFFLFINPNILNQNNISTKNPINSPSSVPSFTTEPQATPNTDTYSDLVNYALSLINSDRQSNGLQNVSLSSIDSAQLHAEDMLKNGYVSHWDMNGYKPYMRYTLAGGQGAVAENIAWQGETGNIVGINVESALKDMEYKNGNLMQPSPSRILIRSLDKSRHTCKIGIALQYSIMFLELHYLRMQGYFVSMTFCNIGH